MVIVQLNIKFMKRIFVGIDISKDWMDYAVCSDKQEGVSNSERMANTVEGITSMFKSLLKKYNKSDLWFCFEHTGNYGLLLSSLLQSERFCYTAAPAIEIKKSIGISRGKNDYIDAKRIAEYAATHSHKLKESQLPSKELLEVKNLLAYRAQLTKIKSQLINSSKSYRVAQQVVDINYISEDLEEKISGLVKSIKKVEKKIETVISSNKELTNNYALIGSVKGIGLVVTAFILVYTNNFTTFDNPRKFNCFTGIAPFEHSSGMNKGISKTSHYRHKYLKSLLFNCANSAAQYDPQLKKYYERKKKEGKKHLCIMNAIACKLIARVFATVKRQSPYVIFVQ